MNPFLETMKSTVDTMQEMDADGLRRFAIEQADRVLSGYGYSRGPSVGRQVITHLASFGVGVAVGAGLGVLMAPSDGATTRERIRDASTDAYDRMNEKLVEVREAARSQIEERVSSGNGASTPDGQAKSSGTRWPEERGSHA